MYTDYVVVLALVVVPCFAVVVPVALSRYALRPLLPQQKSA